MSVKLFCSESEIPAANIHELLLLAVVKRWTETPTWGQLHYFTSSIDISIENYMSYIVIFTFEEVQYVWLV